jgi:tetratricopeptide (TPR) repeat protein
MGVSLVVIGATLWRKVPQLRVMNVAELPEEKTRQIKEAIILKRFERMANDRLSGLFAVVQAGAKIVFRLGRRLVQRLYAMEQYYRKLQRGMHEGPHATDPEAIRKLMEEAEEFIRKGEYFQAEKRYIEIISHNPKHVEAYEDLGNLYLIDRQYAQARETLAFASKLNPDDASVQVSLGEIETKEGNHVAALKRFAKAIELRPHNPKYLDFFIEAAIAAKNAEEANRGLELLRAVNPENQKLQDFEGRIASI